MLEHIRPTYNNIAKKLCSKKWTIHNSWFQQYENKDEHPWHVHSTCQFSNVYYLELPNKDLVTEFKDKKIDVKKVEEGCLITFPSFKSFIIVILSDFIKLIDSFATIKVSLNSSIISERI